MLEKRKISKQYVDNMLKLLAEKEKNRVNKEIVLQTLVELTDKLHKQGDLTDEYKNLMLKEVERRIVEK